MARAGTERQQVERALRESREDAGLPQEKMEDGGDEIERLLSLPVRHRGGTRMNRTEKLKPGDFVTPSETHFGGL